MTDIVKHLAIDIAWAGGLFEGEGWIGAKHTDHTRYSIAIHMTDLDTLERFQRALGFGRIAGPFTNQKADGSVRKPSWRWETHSFEKVQAAAAMLWPYLSSRRKAQAKEALSCQN